MDFSEKDRLPKVAERKCKIKKNKKEQVQFRTLLRKTPGSGTKKNVNKKGEPSAKNGKMYLSGYNSMRVKKKCFAVCAGNFLP